MALLRPLPTPVPVATPAPAPGSNITGRMEPTFVPTAWTPPAAPAAPAAVAPIGKGQRHSRNGARLSDQRAMGLDRQGRQAAAALGVVNGAAPVQRPTNQLDRQQRLASKFASVYNGLTPPPAPAAAPISPEALPNAAGQVGVVPTKKTGLINAASGF